MALAAIATLVAAKQSSLPPHIMTHDCTRCRWSVDHLAGNMVSSWNQQRPASVASNSSATSGLRK
jgi:hypothetical protein